MTVTFILFGDLNALHFSKDLIEDACVAEERGSGFLPAAEVVNREQVFDRWILFGCCFRYFRDQENASRVWQRFAVPLG